MFRVEQSTGKATLNAEAFDLSGLRQLSLGSVALGNFGATINEFSTDGTMGDNSDNALVTEKAIRTFVENQLGGGNNNLTVNSAVIGEITIAGSNISASTGNTVNFTTIPTTSISPTASTHIVKKGDNLSRIASIYGVSVGQIMEWNGLTNPSLIRAGQPLIVSQGSVNSQSNSPEIDFTNELKVAPNDEGASLQDFFNDSSNEDRPIIDAP